MQFTPWSVWGDVTFWAPNAVVIDSCSGPFSSKAGIHRGPVKIICNIWWHCTIICVCAPLPSKNPEETRFFRGGGLEGAKLLGLTISAKWVWSVSGHFVPSQFVPPVGHLVPKNITSFRYDSKSFRYTHKVYSIQTSSLLTNKKQFKPVCLLINWRWLAWNPLPQAERTALSAEPDADVNPFTSKIWPVTIPSFDGFSREFGVTSRHYRELIVFLDSHILSVWYCIQIVRRIYMFVTLES